MCLIGFKFGDMEGEGSAHIVVGDELCGVVWCMGSGVATLKYNTTQYLMPKTKQQKNNRGFYF